MLPVCNAMQTNDQVQCFTELSGCDETNHFISENFNKKMTNEVATLFCRNHDLTIYEMTQ